MKKRLFLILAIICLALPSWAYQYLVALNGLTGGTAGKLDAIYTGGSTGKYNALSAGDVCMVHNPSTNKDTPYRYYVAGTPQSESSPDIIVPDWSSSGVAYTGNGAWLKDTIDADEIKGVTPSANGLTILGDTFSQMLSAIGAQAADADLTTYAGITPSANAQTLLGETFAQMLSSIGAQAAGSYLTSIDIHGATAETSIADGDEILIYDVTASANRKMTKANFVAGLSGTITDLDDLPGDTIDDNKIDISILANLGTFTGSTIPDSSSIPAALQALETALEGLGGGHSAVTLDSNADNILTMTTQTVGLATQTANYVFAGPTTGAAAVPSFRALVAADIPSLSSIYQPLDSDNTALAALATSGGAAYRTAANTWALRSIAAGTGIAVTNGNGISGNPTVALSVTDLTELTTLSTTTYAPVLNGGTTYKFNLQRIFSSGSDGDYYIPMGNNTSRAATASSDELYFEGNKFKINENGTEKTAANLTDAQTFAALLDLSAGIRIPADQYISLGTTSGANGYGFRVSGGNVQWKNSGGTWADIGGSTGVVGDGSPDGQIPYMNDGNTAQTAEDAFYYEADTNTLYVDNIISGFIVTANTMTATSSLKIDGQVFFDAVVAHGNSGASHTIDWTAGNVQSITTTASCTLTFTAPTGPCHLTLKITHEASATAYTYTWPAAVKWPSGTAISCTNSSGAVDMVSIYYDGTNYYATGLNNFF